MISSPIPIYFISQSNIDELAKAQQHQARWQDELESSRESHDMVLMDMTGVHVKGWRHSRNTWYWGRGLVDVDRKIVELKRKADDAHDRTRSHRGALPARDKRLYDSRGDPHQESGMFGWSCQGHDMRPPRGRLRVTCQIKNRMKSATSKKRSIWSQNSIGGTPEAGRQASGCKSPWYKDNLGQAWAEVRSTSSTGVRRLGAQRKQHFSSDWIRQTHGRATWHMRTIVTPAQWVDFFCLRVLFSAPDGRLMIDEHSLGDPTNSVSSHFITQLQKRRMSVEEQDALKQISTRKAHYTWSMTTFEQMELMTEHWTYQIFSELPGCRAGLLRQAAGKCESVNRQVCMGNRCCYVSLFQIAFFGGMLCTRVNRYRSLSNPPSRGITIACAPGCAMFRDIGSWEVGQIMNLSDGRPIRLWQTDSPQIQHLHPLMLCGTVHSSPVSHGRHIFCDVSEMEHHWIVWFHCRTALFPLEERWTGKTSVRRLITQSFRTSNDPRLPSSRSDALFWSVKDRFVSHGADQIPISRQEPTDKSMVTSQTWPLWRKEGSGLLSSTGKIAVLQWNHGHSVSESWTDLISLELHHKLQWYENDGRSCK